MCFCWIFWIMLNLKMNSGTTQTSSLRKSRVRRLLRWGRTPFQRILKRFLFFKKYLKKNKIPKFYLYSIFDSINLNKKIEKKLKKAFSRGPLVADLVADCFSCLALESAAAVQRGSALPRCPPFSSFYLFWERAAVFSSLFFRRFRLFSGSVAVGFRARAANRKSEIGLIRAILIRCQKSRLTISPRNFRIFAPTYEKISSTN